MLTLSQYMPVKPQPDKLQHKPHNHTTTAQHTIQPNHIPILGICVNLV
ncbi:hypothetical protein LIQ05_13010 [Blautia glucerasea]|nr:hypothetical protein [Blautia glucerasea]MCB5387905.1 hypothetical protein [Blautia glucerasea]MCB5422238.1 hypothetical protein [Blautia luti]